MRRLGGLTLHPSNTFTKHLLQARPQSDAEGNLSWARVLSSRSANRSHTCEECIQSRVPRGCGEWEEGPQDLLSHLGRSLSTFSLLGKWYREQAVVSIDGQFPVSSSSFAPSVSCLDLFAPLGQKLQEGWAASGFPAHAQCLGPN